ncbi:hypothetical protein IFM89_030297 [Coptis chinensis]|uniref:Uncharacterized protein n=1 Tax=Coptis chinensis TaxID=261450 RepID=A0A835M7L9_9MAGN|nr:hypothetical protein IFM89_030297 [Coptis chinensis]
MFKSLLSSTPFSRTQPKRNGWSLVSKLMHTKLVECQVEEADIFKLEKLDVALFTLISKKLSKGIKVKNVENVQKQLRAMELSIQGLEDKLEKIYKSLIKTRVSLLNILSH